MTRGEVPVRQGHAVGRVPDPVHEGKNPLVEPRPREVVLDDDDGGSAGALGEERGGVVCVMEDVHEKNSGCPAVGDGQVAAVEAGDRDHGVRPLEDVESLDHEVRPQGEQGSGYVPVAASDVENTPCGKEGRKPLREDADASRKDGAAVESPDGRERRGGPSLAHRRFSPRMDRKNADRMA